MALDILSIGAAIALTDGTAASAANKAASDANAAAAAANQAASNADAAKTRANTAAAGAETYAAQYSAMSQKASMDDADLRMLQSQQQAYVRKHDSRITELEKKVAAMAG